MERDGSAGEDGRLFGEERKGSGAIEAPSVGAGEEPATYEIIKMMEEDKKLKEKSLEVPVV